MSAAAANTPSWSDYEVRTLIAIWGEDRIQELDGAVRNQAIFAKKMCQKAMTEIGNNVGIKSKIRIK